MRVKPADWGWERRALIDLLDGPRTYCFPGFMGAVHERLVRRGYAVRETAGFMAPLPGRTATQLKRDGWNEKDHPQFRYSLSDTGRSRVRALAGEAA